MRWRAGIFYRIPDLLDLVNEQKLEQDNLLASFPGYFHNVNPRDLINISIKAKWLSKNDKGLLELTAGGQYLLRISDKIRQLRHIINSLLEVSMPNWAASAIQGRAAVKEYAPPEAIQCLEEAGYFDSLDEEVINWWDKLATKFRKENESENLETGRLGERKSYEYEHIRTGKYPEWRSIELAGLGYDLISQVDRTDTQKLLIEVKASRETWERARFHLTKNEWNTLNTAEYAVVHLWGLTDYPDSPSILHIRSLGTQIPENRGEAEWQITACPFAVFPRPE